jgi:hypothetical protein
VAALWSEERNRLGDGNTRRQERSLSTLNPQLSTENEPISLLFTYTHTVLQVILKSPFISTETGTIE